MATHQYQETFSIGSGANNAKTHLVPVRNGDRLRCISFGASLSSGPYYVVAFVGDNTQNFSTLLGSGWVRNDANGIASDSLSFPYLDLPTDIDTETFNINFFCRNDTGTAGNLFLDLMVESK